jgi:hypothetical protein
MRASDSMASLMASSTSMVVRLETLLRTMALERALMTKRGLTPDRPSSGCSVRSRSISLPPMPSTLSPA